MEKEKEDFESTSVFNIKIGVIFIIALAFNSIFSMTVFLTILQFTIWEWALMNMCAPTSFATIGGMIYYIYRRKGLHFLGACTVFLFTFSIVGFFLGWNLWMLQAQITHIIMIITGIYIWYFILKDGQISLKSFLLFGVLPGVILVLLMFFVVYPIFFTLNPSIWQKLYPG